MLAVNYTTLRSNFKAFCDKATDERETVIVTRKGEKNLVLMSLEQYSKMLRTISDMEYLTHNGEKENEKE